MDAARETCVNLVGFRRLEPRSQAGAELVQANDQEVRVLEGCAHLLHVHACDLTEQTLRMPQLRQFPLLEALHPFILTERVRCSARRTAQQPHMSAAMWDAQR